MARKISKEEMKIRESIKRLPFKDEDKNGWIEIINTAGMNEEIAKEMLSLSAESTPEDEEEALDFARNTSALNRNIRTWRLSKNLRDFSGRGRRRGR